jgi:hypothetical protein
MAKQNTESFNNNEHPENGRFESDTQRVVRQHLEDKDHVISHDDIANVRVGMSPPLDKPTEEAVRLSEEKVADHKADSEDDTLPGAQKISPWDVIDPGA